MNRPKLLDLFSGAGGAAVGYDRAGFDVTGVDNRPQPRYPFRFILADALEYIAAHGHEYDAIHASPPCQAYSRMLTWKKETDSPALIEPTREVLRRSGRPWVMENVERAPLAGFVLTLCGTAFGLPIRRHRLFEMEPPLPILVSPCHCRNGVRDGRLVGAWARPPVQHNGQIGRRVSDAAVRDSLGVPWMRTKEARQAIPPAYTRFVGEALRSAVAAVAVGAERAAIRIGVPAATGPGAERKEEQSAVDATAVTRKAAERLTRRP